MNKLNARHGEGPNEPSKDWNNQPLADHFKSSTYTPNTSPVVSSIMGRLNHQSIGNGYVEFHPS